MDQTSDSSNDLVANLDESVLLPQLGCPSGEVGVAVGDMLERSNEAVINASFDLLDLHAGEQIMEVGLGNGGHIPAVLSRAPGLRYAGVDISPTMIEVARSRNAFSIARKQVVLEVADVSLLPFADHTFDKAVAINTVYFWTSLAAGLREIRRVLRSNGVLAIAAITPDAAIEMPFAAYGFAVYDALALELACMAAGFNQVCIEPFVEPLTNPQAEAAPREFFLVSASASNG